MNKRTPLIRKSLRREKRGMYVCGMRATRRASGVWVLRHCGYGWTPKAAYQAWQTVMKLRAAR